MSDFIKDYYTKLHSKKDHRINENGHKYKHTYELRKNIIKYMLNKINFNKSLDILALIKELKQDGYVHILEGEKEDRL